MIDRKRFVAEVETYVGAPIVHHGRSRSGIDCVGLIFCAMNRIAGTRIDFLAYGPRPTTRLILRAVKRFADRIVPVIAVPGDVVLLSYENHPTHFGVLARRGVVHADNAIGYVVEHALPQNRRHGRVAAYFRLRGMGPWLA